MKTFGLFARVNGWVGNLYLRNTETRNFARGIPGQPRNHKLESSMITSPGWTRATRTGHAEFNVRYMVPYIA